MSENENKIMDAADIHKTVKRIAYQIYETHFEEKQLVLAGVAYNGVVLAKRIQEELGKISQNLPQRSKIYKKSRRQRRAKNHCTRT